ncbi:hypothetical protein JCM5350_003991 [Sporobolomyces pararoseus]
MDCLTPPPTPPHRDQLALSPLTSSPLTETNNNQNSNNNNDNNSLAQVNTLLLRSRCDSEKTLLDESNTEGEEEEEEEGQVESGNQVQEESVQVRVTLEVRIGRESSPREVAEKIESDLREVLNGLRENKERGQGETKGSEFQKMQEELRVVKRQLDVLQKRAQQSVQDLRLNNQSLCLQASEAIKISHQAEQDLDKVLEAFKSNRTRGSQGGSSWVVAFALFVYVVLSKCS